MTARLSGTIDREDTLITQENLELIIETGTGQLKEQDKNLSKDSEKVNTLALISNEDINSGQDI